MSTREKVQFTQYIITDTKRLSLLHGCLNCVQYTAMWYYIKTTVNCEFFLLSYAANILFFLKRNKKLLSEEANKM